MSNDYTFLTEGLAELLDKYTDDDVLQDLSLWESDDLLAMIAIIDDALELHGDDIDLDRLRDMALLEEEEADMSIVTEYLDEVYPDPLDELLDAEAEFDG